MCARGEAPNVARLIEMGVAFGHGAMASLPTVTLANHTSIITGAHPGHHGILNNAWFDRCRPASRSSPTRRRRGRRAMEHLTPGIESIHDAVHRTWPDAFTASVNEPCDTGADYSTFDFFRRGDVPPIPKDPFGLPHTTERFVRPSKDYSWSSVVDHMGVDQALGIISRSLPRRELPDAAVHVVQLHAHRRGDARRRPALRDGGRVGARQRRPARRDPRRGRASAASSTTARSCSSPTTAWRRTTRRAAATGTSRCARPASKPATRPTASSTSAPDRSARHACAGSLASCSVVLVARRVARRVRAGAARGQPGPRPDDAGDGNGSSDSDFAKLYETRRTRSSRSRSRRRQRRRDDLRAGRQRQQRLHRAATRRPSRHRAARSCAHGLGRAATCSERCPAGVDASRVPRAIFNAGKHLRQRARRQARRRVVEDDRRPRRGVRHDLARRASAAAVGAAIASRSRARAPTASTRTPACCSRFPARTTTATRRPRSS